MADQNSTTSPSIEDLSRRVIALEGSSKQNADLLNELAIETGEHFKQLKEMIAASKRVDTVLPPAGGKPPSPPAPAATSTKKDAWGKPLGPDGKVVAQPQPTPPAPAPAAGEAATCTCNGHDPAHGPKGCTVKGCSCSETA
jgi:hypothetical protein